MIFHQRRNSYWNLIHLFYINITFHCVKYCWTREKKYPEKKGHDRQVWKEGMSKEEKSNIYDDTKYTESNRNNNRIIWEVMHTLWHIRDVKINLHMVSTRLPPRIFITKVFSITSIIFGNTFYCYTITILHQSDKKKFTIDIS